MACEPFTVLGTTVFGGQAAGGTSWKTGGKSQADGAANWVDGRPRMKNEEAPGRPSCSISISLRSARSSTMRCHSSRAMVDRETVEELLAQDQSEKGAEDVAADAGVGLVKDWAGGEQRLCGFEGVLHGQQIAVSQNDLKSGDFGVSVRSTKRPSNRASALTLARSMTKPSPWGVLRKRRKPLLATSALSPWASLRSRPATSSARVAASAKTASNAYRTRPPRIAR